MINNIVKIKFTSPLRIGRPGIGLENTNDRINSDTLFSALCHVYDEMYGREAISEFLDDYDAGPPFLLSSCFPFVGNEYYLPRPFVHFNLPNDDQSLKKLKKIRYLPFQILCQDFKNTPFPLENLYEHNARILASRTDFVTPRIAKDRFDDSTQIFYCGSKVFAENSGLYVIVRCRDNSAFNLLQGLMNMLGENGIGGERGVGFGRFNPQWQKADEMWATLFNETGTMFYLAGLYHPGAGQNTHAPFGSTWSLCERRGWFYSRSSGRQYKRKTVWMFAEGSVFSERPLGRLVDVTPSVLLKSGHHKIYRCGRPVVLTLS
ncbi:type III-A CRISPR-associated RAMP protein Csm4 [candidate division KSB1 bacterium]|nr:type III-A CRISPR-associated RAMP protein Csm4 [candidate division KSB1 bacterium]